jgi:hypothetical protein
MVLHGDAAWPQLLESVPFEGLTMTEVIVVARPPADGNADAMQQNEKIDKQKSVARHRRCCVRMLALAREYHISVASL